MRPYFTPPSDQEDKANEAMGALEALHDLMTLCAPEATVPVANVSYLLKIVCYAVHRAMPDGKPRHRRPCNDLEEC